MKIRSFASYLRQQKRTEMHQTEGETVSFITFSETENGPIRIDAKYGDFLDDFDNCIYSEILFTSRLGSAFLGHLVLERTRKVIVSNERKSLCRC